MDMLVLWIAFFLTMKLKLLTHGTNANSSRIQLPFNDFLI